MSVAVIYLSRGLGGGRASAEAFFETYRKFPAGREHELFVISKGWQSGAELDEVTKLVANMSGNILAMPDDGYDWGAYFRLAWYLNHDWLCFFNTHTRIDADRWLDILLQAAEIPGVGAAGATGSWGTLVPQFYLRHLLRPGILLYPPRFFGSIKRFPSFPNPHLRSNAFVVRRDVFLAFAAQSIFPRTKRDAHALESGRAGFTYYLMSHGLRPVVVGKDGRSFEIESWIESETFRVPGQRNLLIKDNQTEYYNFADKKIKFVMEESAWGKIFD